MSEIEITGVFENVLGMIYSAKQKAEYLSLIHISEPTRP